jgi:hypothetical protein
MASSAFGAFARLNEFPAGARALRAETVFDASLVLDPRR